MYCITYKWSTLKRVNLWLPASCQLASFRENVSVYIKFSSYLRYRGDGVSLMQQSLLISRSTILMHISDAYIRIKPPRKFSARRGIKVSAVPLPLFFLSRGALSIFKFSRRRIDPQTIHRPRRHTFHVSRRIHLCAFVRAVSSRERLSRPCWFVKSSNYRQSYNNRSTILSFSIAFWTVACKLWCVHDARRKQNGDKQTAQLLLPTRILTPNSWHFLHQLCASRRESSMCHRDEHCPALLLAISAHAST